MSVQDGSKGYLLEVPLDASGIEGFVPDREVKGEMRDRPRFCPFHLPDSMTWPDLKNAEVPTPISETPYPQLQTGSIT
ncbi:hypothetical protein [Thiohalocapsa sp. ML1]|uniref:hypothetical protein n=1 Tax=Thiohalocapsa sp. ML1 TaxID=1431688 RepID=UPI001C1F66DA|nr:hypothetical protein [Thiohalocapsa sp. ML1]